MTARRADSKLKASTRPDRRGHWPAGVRRSDLDPAVLPAIRAARTAMTLRQMAARLGANPKTVHKWLAGVNQPSPEFQARILRDLSDPPKRPGRYGRIK